MDKKMARGQKGKGKIKEVQRRAAALSVGLPRVQTMSGGEGPDWSMGRTVSGVDNKDEPLGMKSRCF